MTALALAGAFALSLPFLFVLARRPVLRRLAVRNAVRRPREAALVVLGSMLGTAIITGSLVVGDTIGSSIRQIARTHLGPIDEIVYAENQGDWMVLGSKLVTISSRNVDGVLPIVSLDAAATSIGKQREAVPRSQVLGLDFAAARRFGGDPSATGISGPTPPFRHAAITSDLARALRIGAGDGIDVWAYGRRTRLTVDRILPRRGVAGMWLGYETEARNVLVGFDTFSALSAPTRSLHGDRYAPPSFALAVSNRGGVESGVGLTGRVTEEIRQTTGENVRVLAAKEVALDSADAQGDAFTDLFSGMGSFGVLAGLLLLVNLFVMLAAERKPELGMARAVGMRRSWLVGAFATEGWLYAFAAALLGTMTGIGLGRVIILASERVFSSEHNRFELFFTVRPASIALGFAVGLGIALVTVVATSVRVSRLNIIAAIRDLQERPRRRRRWLWLALGVLAVVVGLAWTASALPDEEPVGLLLGPMIALAGLGPALTRLAPARAVVSALAALVVVWGVTVFALFPHSADEASMTVWVAQGVSLTAAAVTLVATQQELIGRLVYRLFPGRLALRLGLAYPLARRSRTGLTVAMYALVVFILTFVTTLSSMIGGQVDSATTKVAGGYAVAVSSSPGNPVPPRELAALPGVTGVAPLSTITAEFTPGGKGRATPWRLTAFDRRFIARGRVLQDRGSYPSDRAAWEAVLRNPGLMIVDESFLTTGGGPGTALPEVGDRYTLANPFTGTKRTVTIAAFAEPDVLINNGALYGAAGARRLFGDRLVPNRAYVALAPGVDPEPFAANVQSTYLANGAEAASIRSYMAEAFGIWDAMFQLFEGYLGLGLIVGIAGLAVVMVRAVRERRRQIGMLRALGFGWRTVGRSFAIEAGFIAIEGTLIGTALALLTIYNIVANTDAFGDMTFTVPWLELAILLVATVSASLLATMGPAISATRIRPAVALRTTD
jgi:putative ABC transport system permease protein